MKRLIISLCALLLASSAGSALAQDAAFKAAREAFDRGQVLFEAKSFPEAAAEFQKAYQAKPFPQFLFNIGACHERLNQWDKAVEFYSRYLSESPKAKDKEPLSKRIEVLKREIERAKTTPPDPAQPDGTPDKPVAPSQEIENLESITLRGLVVIDSEPRGATVYLGDRKGKVLGKTVYQDPTLLGSHKIYIEKRGYEPKEAEIYTPKGRFTYWWFGLKKEDYLGWLEVKSNVPGAEIYIDDKAAGAFATTPFAGNMKPGKHTIWVAKKGYNEVKKEIEIIRGQTHEIKLNLDSNPVGDVKFSGKRIQYEKVYVDGKLECDPGPCDKLLPVGTHKVSIKRSDWKTYSTTLNVRANTVTTVESNLQPKPSTVKYVVPVLLGAGIAGFGGYLLAGQGDRKDQDPGMDGVQAGDGGLWCDDGDGDDLCKSEVWLYGGIGFLAAGSSLALYGAYQMFIAEHGPPSSAGVQVQTAGLQPQIGPGYAGLSWGSLF